MLEQGKLFHGGDYNPEQWLDRPDILQQDIEWMERARVNVVTLGVFSWSTLEPREGEFELDWLAEIIHKLYAHGISTVLATPTGARPPWMAQKYPEVRRVRADRVRELYNRRQNHCYTSPVYREKTRIIDEKLAQRFGDDPAVVLWHINNEFGGECHCELCQQAFRTWLQRKYGDLHTLSKAWNGKFWSHEYTDWSQIESPAPHGENAVQGLVLDWKRFVSDQTIDFYKWECDSVRKYAPQAQFTVNMMYRFGGLDYFRFAQEVDVVSWDNYPTWHKPAETMEETALDTAMMHDLFYSLKQKPFLMMESSPSFTNWQPISKPKRPGVAMLSALQAVAHGSDSVMYFQWRASRGAEEKFHGAVIGHDGRDDARPFRETCEVGEALERLCKTANLPKQKQAAIVMDWDNMWALEGSSGPRNAGLGYWKELLRHYSGLARGGYTVDFVDQRGDLEGYGLVVVPMLYLLREEFAAKLRAFANAGGTLVVTYWTGVVDETDLCRLGDTPYGLTEVLGLRRAEFDGMYDGETRRCKATAAAPAELPQQAQAGTLCEVAMPEGATTLLAYDEDYYAGAPAVARHAYGAGTAYYLAARFEDAFYTGFYAAVAPLAGLTPAWEGPLPAGVLATRREQMVFLQNYNDHAVDCGKVQLPPYGTAVLEQRGDGMTRLL